MTSSSRSARPKVAPIKIPARRRKAKARRDAAKAEKAVVVKARQALREADVVSLTHAINEENRRRGKDELGAVYFARRAVRYGGSIHSQQWYRYLKGELPVPLIDQLGITEEFRGKRPQDLFPSFPFPSLTPIAPFAASDAVGTLVALYLSVTTASQRAAILTAAHGAVTGERGNKPRAK